MKSANKSDLAKELERQHLGASLREPPVGLMPTTYLVDVMANLRKLRTNTRENKSFGVFVNDFLSYVQNICKEASRLDLVFDSYIERTIKDSERQKRCRSVSVELNKVDKDTPMPVQMEAFLPSIKNKSFLESLIHENDMIYPQIIFFSGKLYGHEYFHYFDSNIIQIY